MPNLIVQSGADQLHTEYTTSETEHCHLRTPRDRAFEVLHQCLALCCAPCRHAMLEPRVGLDHARDIVLHERQLEWIVKRYCVDRTMTLMASIEANSRSWAQPADEMVEIQSSYRILISRSALDVVPTSSSMDHRPCQKSRQA